ncbi:phosphohistidine phosphatase SixA [Dasania sp. GY-MA-18]|uniref:Phosphohistidine phosphatase SixA n=1 Tax=Dasania phycosphaerae TaxID=2950436 RepID=A0A9J6RM20_9GAMM|nr:MULTISPECIES: phosphohistidine phosphatase SixA [Dasania]MCR8922930.1 phosphohistidine phosphatase SixA [Dasania sp. GY-MA-18]MCZ0865361.1 phosphohistidine phosphatase SixA [Dasania phycosphaerae]MCZ0869086.1 phosphohistidine phosphatase SixA [Dasania phycosphaerae]
MEIVILRHGQAEGYATSDASRNLTERGKADALRAGACLAELGLQFDALWVSPYVRAQQTAQQLLTSLPDLQIVSLDMLTPESDLKSVFDFIHRSGLQRVLLVSHQPLVSDLVAYMTEPNGYGPAMAPASMACVENKHGLPGCGELRWLRHAPEFARE